MPCGRVRGATRIVVPGRAYRAMNAAGIGMQDIDAIRRHGTARPGSAGDCIIMGYDLGGSPRTLRFHVGTHVILADVD